MDELHLTETEQRYFSDLFVCCDNENTGHVSIIKAVELFRSGNISNDALSQITDICCHKQNQHSSNNFNRKQFYSILKLIAAHQANIPVHVDILSSTVELPLPRFTWPNSENQKSKLSIEKHVRDDTDRKCHKHLTYKSYIDSSVSTDSEVEVQDTSESNNFHRNGSPEASSTASDSPTPTNSVQERAWVVSGNWQGLVCEEQRQLLGTEEESSDRHSSEDDTEVANEVWQITAEQREYYANQFRSLQPDLNGLLAGSIARLFFEKSRLPVSELRKIWQLSDVTKDGALNLQEFNIAMHLVVLRRNHISLPATLPPQLLPDTGDNTVPVSPSIESTSASPPPTKESAKEWTKFVDSPTSSISSPGPKPVNFDFQKASVEKDPKILHPVPLRLTPDIAAVTQPEPELTVVNEQLDMTSPKKHLENNLTVNEIKPIQRPQPKKIGLPGRGAIPPPPPHSCSVDEGPVSLPAPKKEPPPPPPPRPFRSHGRSSSLDLNRLGKSSLLATPPTVPPRISPNIPSPSKKLINQRSEGDAIALAGDENAFADFDSFQQVLVDEPTEKYENVTETIFPGDMYEADRKKLFAQFIQEESDVTDCSMPRKHGAFEVYRKPLSRNKESPIPSEDAAKWELFQKLKDQNTVLLRLCQELSQELVDVREERTTLRLRLEQQQQQQQQQQNSVG